MTNLGENKMKNYKSTGGLIASAILLISMAAIGVSAQGAKTARIVPVPNGEKVKVQGVVSLRDGDSFKVRDMSGAETVVMLTRETDVTSHTRGLRGKKDYPVTYIMRGLRVQAQGRGDGSGNLVADWVRFDEQDLRSAQALEQTAELAEDNAARIAAAEENARKLAAQIEENTALANAAQASANEANSKAEAAQATATQAFKDAAMANNRINGLDSYDLVRTVPVLFPVGSSKLTKSAMASMDEAKAWVDEQRAAGKTNGWLVQVVGFADSTGKSAKNTALSNARAKAVIDRMVRVYDFDLRRLVQPYGYGDSKPIASNKTVSGRAQNRRVEVRILQNRGIANTVGNQ
jgi:outer membrane protein OmpA-like peptidoglycan-associated protein